VPCPRTQQVNLPAYLHTKPFKCWTSSKEAVNTNYYQVFWSDSAGESNPSLPTRRTLLPLGHAPVKCSTCVVVPQAFPLLSQQNLFEKPFYGIRCTWSNHLNRGLSIQRSSSSKFRYSNFAFLIFKENGRSVTFKNLRNMCGIGLKW